MAKYDIKVVHRSVYSGREGDFALLDVPPISYLAVDGEGDPNTAPGYAEAVTALFSLAYAVKFASTASGQDFVVGPLEGLWRSDDLGAFRRREKDVWHWTMLIAQPDWITAEAVDRGRPPCGRRKARRASMRSDWRGSRRASRCRSCMSARTTRRRRPVKRVARAPFPADRR